MQIHFVNENHWVASCFMNRVVSLYDRLSTGTISAGLEEQLARSYGRLEGSADQRDPAPLLNCYNLLSHVTTLSQACFLLVKVSIAVLVTGKAR